MVRVPLVTLGLTCLGLEPLSVGVAGFEEDRIEKVFDLGTVGLLGGRLGLG